MPATRSRTENWKDALLNIAQRGGALEIALRSSHDQLPGAPSDLLWRVRIHQVTDQEILVECPSAFGASFRLDAGAELVVSMSIGQNRWMFASRTLGHRAVRPGGGVAPHAMVIAMPDRVERCARRQFFRMSTAALRLPGVECWPLLDPASVVAAETANRALIQERLAPGAEGLTPLPSFPPAPAETMLLPSVGIQFQSRLLNISGGGVGLLVAPEHAAAVDTRQYVWMRIDLRPHLPVPLAITARRAHAHMDSAQNLYVGFAFDFSHNPAHQRFVTDILTRYVQTLQRHQHELRVALATSA